jgi:rubrerythrin
MKNNNIHRFLAHAVRLEADSAQRFDELADAMQTSGNHEVESFFRKMAHFSRLHLAEATARAGLGHAPQLSPEEYQWPDGSSPEASDWIGVDGLIEVSYALQMALAGEQRACQFYTAIAATTSDIRVRQLAEEFAVEESQHVAELEKWIARFSERRA